MEELADRFVADRSVRVVADGPWRRPLVHPDLLAA